MKRPARTRIVLASLAALCAAALAACDGAGPAGTGTTAPAPSVSAASTGAPSPGSTTPTASNPSSAAPVTSPAMPTNTASSTAPTGSKIPWPPETSPVPSTTSAPEWTVPSASTIGACVTINKSLRIDEASFGVVPCTELHDAQVVGHGTMPESFDRNAKGAFARLMVDQCDPHFAEYTGTTYANSRLVSTGFAANRSEYAQGERTLVCIITMRDRTKFSGDARGKTDESEFGHAEGWNPPQGGSPGSSGEPGGGQRA